MLGKTIALVARRDKAPARKSGVLAFGRFIANGAVIWTLTFQSVDRKISAKRVRIDISMLASFEGRDRAAKILGEALRSGEADALRRSRACYAKGGKV